MAFTSRANRFVKHKNEEHLNKTDPGSYNIEIRSRSTVNPYNPPTLESTTYRGPFLYESDEYQPEPGQYFTEEIESLPAATTHSVFKSETQQPVFVVNNHSKTPIPGPTDYDVFRGPVPRTRHLYGDKDYAKFDVTQRILRKIQSSLRRPSTLCKCAGIITGLFVALKYMGGWDIDALQTKRNEEGSKFEIVPSQCEVSSELSEVFQNIAENNWWNVHGDADRKADRPLRSRSGDGSDLHQVCLSVCDFSSVNMLGSLFVNLF